MGKFFMGLLVGIILCVLGGLMALPGVKQAAHDSGVAEGTKTGMAQGTTAGIAQGIAQVKAEQKQKHTTDSTAAAHRYQQARRKAAATKVKEKPKPVQNWHVIDGKIEDPIIN